MVLDSGDSRAAAAGTKMFDKGELAAILRFGAEALFQQDAEVRPPALPASAVSMQRLRAEAGAVAVDRLHGLRNWTAQDAGVWDIAAHGLHIAHAHPYAGQCAAAGGRGH